MRPCPSTSRNMNPVAAMRTPAIAAEARAPLARARMGGGRPLWLQCADRDALGGRESCITRADCVGAEQSDRSGTRARHAAPRRGKSPIGGAPQPPSFYPSFSKSRLFFSKLFQRKLWPFCGISMGCKPSKPKVSTSKYFDFSLGSKNPSRASRSVGIVEGTSKHGSIDCVFPKDNSTPPISAPPSNEVAELLHRMPAARAGTIGDHPITPLSARLSRKCRQKNDVFRPRSCCDACKEGLS